MQLNLNSNSPENCPNSFEVIKVKFALILLTRTQVDATGLPARAWVGGVTPGVASAIGITTVVAGGGHGTVVGKVSIQTAG